MRKIQATTSYFCSLAVTAVCAVLPALSNAAAPADATILTAMSTMEVRLLDHDYHSDTEEQRLVRLEKFVFGGPESGTIQARVDRLKAAIVPAPDESPAAIAAAAKPANVPSTHTASAPKNGQPIATAQAKAQPKVSYDPSDYGSYPRVGQLEQQFFGKTFDSDPLPVRVSRLETKEFGKPSTNEDLCDRMDKLDRVALKPAPAAPDAASSSPALAYANPRNPVPFGGFGAPASNEPDGSSEDSHTPTIQNPFAPGSIQINGAEQRTTTLEKFVFGHEHTGKPLAERVQRLEKKLVPYEHNSDKDMATRVDHLWTMMSAANTMNNSPISTD